MTEKNFFIRSEIQDITDVLKRQSFYVIVTGKEDKNNGLSMCRKGNVMAGKARLPLGIENFKRIRTGKYYYVDKTGMIRDLLENLAYVNLFTRPRRFGKTLNMSMLQYFFDVDGDKELFEGLDISKEKELCEEYMGKFPVISITLKSVSGRTFDEAKGMLRDIIGNMAMKFQFLIESDHLTKIERRRYEKMIGMDEKGDFSMSDVLLKSSLLILSQFLQKHYGQSVVILVDEYDVPLDKAYQQGYYDEMVDLIKGMFTNAFKTNDSLYFAVLTGCLRVSKESIFTGLNNFKVYTVKDIRYNEYFGFTDIQVRQMLEYYGFMNQYDGVKEWYDGYLFGNLNTYCPWDVINYCGDLRDGSVTEPQNYWVNTSSNDIIKRFLTKANATTKNEIELLIHGGSVKKMIYQELTYKDLDARLDNLWSILYTTGYLTQCSGQTGDLTELVIPNKEIQWIFVQQIREWMKEEISKGTQTLENFCRAFQENDAPAVEKYFNEYLWNTISIRDTGAKNEQKENFYHGILLGILGNIDHWIVRSNAESGEGYSDITIEIPQRGIGIVIELKYAKNGAFEKECQKAIQQIKDRGYEDALRKNGMKKIYRYGIACEKKQCMVVSE